MLQTITKLASLRNFYFFCGKLLPWFAWPTLILMLVGLYWGLVEAPADYQQKDSYRIIFIHVPAAWMSLFVYMVMATSAAASLIWKTKASEVVANSCAPVGAAFTFLALATGSLWGKPMWGTWWEWDARLTSELVLLFLYLGYIALQSAFEDKRTAARATAILAIVGVVNIPIIHYSVEWWYTLHQGPTVQVMKNKQAMDISMLIPLLIMATAFKFYFATVLLMFSRNEILERESHTKWVQEERERL